MIRRRPHLVRAIQRPFAHQHLALLEIVRAPVFSFHLAATEALAEASGFDRAVLGRIKRESQNITMTSVSRIANAMDIDLGEMLQGLPRYDADSDELPSD